MVFRREHEHGPTPGALPSPALERPLLLFDGDCLFCRAWVARWQALAGGKVDVAPAQLEGHRFPHVPREQYAASVVLVEPDGTTTLAAEAVLRMLALGGLGAPAWCYRHVPGMARLLESGYRFVAHRRGVFSFATTLLWGAAGPGASYRIASFLFVRGLGLVFLVAFLSLWSQVAALIGSNGLLPVAPWLEAVSARFGEQAHHVVPTLLWFDASDGALHALCGAGVVLSVLLVLGVAPVACLALLWACMLSLVVGGQEFFSFQWDTLLLEASLLAVFLAPLGWSARAVTWPEPRRLARWMLWWLLFRVMFLSGLVKLLSGDETWRNLTALDFHHLTQPLPTPLGWLAHRLPGEIHALSVLAMFAVELLLPLLIWAPRRLRMLAFAGFVALQAAIALSGNYGFFNLLTLLVALLLMDDACFSARVRGWFAPRVEPAPRRPSRSPVRWPRWLVAVVAVVVLVETSVTGFARLRIRVHWPRPVAAIHWALAPLRSLNGYGLFEVMTTRRREIVIEGSRDGQDWKAYELPYQPGDPARHPPLVAPHMPRLDWQMWFAALSGWRDPNNEFLRIFCGRLLEGSPEALSLVSVNPFPDEPPRYLRTVVYEYRFTTWREWRDTGYWWRRERLGAYGPLLER